MGKQDDLLGSMGAPDTETPENNPFPTGGKRDADENDSGDGAAGDKAGSDAAGESDDAGSEGGGKAGGDAKGDARGADSKGAAAKGDAKPAGDTGGGKGGQGGDSADGGKEHLVPVARLTAERKHFQSEVQQRDSRIAELEAQLKAAKPAEDKKPDPEPDYLEDPKAYIDFKTKGADQTDKVKALEQQIANEKTAREQTIALHQARETIARQEADFLAKHPDYYDALAHARAVRREQLKIDFADATPEQLDGELARQELAYAFGQVARGANPAERAYQYAQTLGYTAKQAAAAVKGDGGKQDPGTQKRGEDGRFESAKDDAEAAAQREAAASLGSGGSEAMAAEVEINENDMFKAAKAERFGKRA